MGVRREIIVVVLVFKALDLFGELTCFCFWFWFLVSCSVFLLTNGLCFLSLSLSLSFLLGSN